jgi:hypothetical protein
MNLKKASVLFATIVVIGNAIAEETKPSSILLAESFDDGDLLTRDWYDGSRFKIVSDGAFAGEGCIEYRWKEKSTSSHTSSGARHPINATEELYSHGTEMRSV